jgi:hypothetical protein
MTKNEALELAIQTLRNRAVDLPIPSARKYMEAARMLTGLKETNAPPTLSVKVEETIKTTDKVG